MTDLVQIASLLDAIVLPLLGLFFLMSSKLAVGETAKLCQGQFILTLIVMTIVTIRTVIHADDQTWLLHTISLGLMVVAALVVPSRESQLAVTIG